MSEITRTEIAAAIRDAFDEAPVQREDLLAAADRNGADAAIVRSLEALPVRQFSELREIWRHLGDVPVTSPN